ncbi:MAG: citrate/2-methylcitrate synthase, partial [Planctomycetota bacterium]
MTAPTPDAGTTAGGPPPVARGLAGVIAGETAISSLDGGLRYRGYGIEPLARAADFEDVAYLLLHGELPDRAEHGRLTARVQA